MRIAKLPAFKPSVVYTDNSQAKLGFNLDKWLHQELINLNVIPSNAVCCKTNNLFLKNGFVFKGKQEGFNINKTLKQVLARLTVTVNGYCCIPKQIKIDYSSIYYSNNNKLGVSFTKWVKSKLTYYGIAFTDICC